MKRVRLAISDGGHVCDVAIPPMMKMPEVIMLGERCFAFHEMLPVPEDQCVAKYREVFAYWVPPDVEPEGK
jgi:hypothetical protein